MDNNERTHPADDGSTVAHLLAGGELLPSQLPTATTWSPEKKLAGAVLTSALSCIRDHYGDAVHADNVEADLAWLADDDWQNPFGFLCLCELFGLDPGWVRARVEGWKRTERGQRAPFSLHRNAA